MSLDDLNFDRRLRDKVLMDNPVAPVDLWATIEAELPVAPRRRRRAMLLWACAAGLGLAVGGALLDTRGIFDRPAVAEHLAFDTSDSGAHSLAYRQLLSATVGASQTSSSKPSPGGKTQDAISSPVVRQPVAQTTGVVGPAQSNDSDLRLPNLLSARPELVIDAPRKPRSEKSNLGGWPQENSEGLAAELSSLSSGTPTASLSISDGVAQLSELSPATLAQAEPGQPFQPRPLSPILRPISPLKALAAGATPARPWQFSLSTTVGLTSVRTVTTNLLRSFGSTAFDMSSSPNTSANRTYQSTAYSAALLNQVGIFAAHYNGIGAAITLGLASQTERGLTINGYESSGNAVLARDPNLSAAVREWRFGLLGSYQRSFGRWTPRLAAGATYVDTRIRTINTDPSGQSLELGYRSFHEGAWLPTAALTIDYRLAARWGLEAETQVFARRLSYGLGLRYRL